MTEISFERVPMLAETYPTFVMQPAVRGIVPIEIEGEPTPMALEPITWRRLIGPFDEKPILIVGHSLVPVGLPP